MKYMVEEMHKVQKYIPSDLYILVKYIVGFTRDNIKFFIDEQYYQ